MPKFDKVLISIPAKNEADNIGSVIDQARAATRAHLPDAEIVVLVVNDGSSDATASIAQDKGAELIHHATSIGLGNVFRDAVAYATRRRFDLLITIDGDGQFEEKEIPKLLEPIQEGHADFVTGSRFLPDSKVSDMPAMKRWGNGVVSSMVSSTLKRRYHDVSCGFRAYSRRAFCSLNLFGGFTYTQEVFLSLGYKNLRIKEVPISVSYDSQRRSRIASSLFRYGVQVFKIIFSSTVFYHPLKFFGTLALINFVIGFPIALGLLVRYLSIGLISPYKALGILSLVLIVLSLLFFIVGLLLQGMSRLQISADRILFYEKYRK